MEILTKDTSWISRRLERSEVVLTTCLSTCAVRHRRGRVFVASETIIMIGHDFFY